MYSRIKVIANQIAVIGALFFSSLPLHAEEESLREESGHTINFYDAPVIEVIRFVSRISEVNFIFNNKDLGFNVTLASGKPVSAEHVLKALLQILKVHGFFVDGEDNYYVIHKKGEAKESVLAEKREEELGLKETLFTGPQLIASSFEPAQHQVAESKEPAEFFIYKLQYHQGSEIEEAMKKIAADMQNKADKPVKLLAAINSLQWIKGTNSLLSSADLETQEALRKLIVSLDVPLKQVFIEVLVVETDVKKAHEFGLEWAAGGKFKDKIGFGMGNFANNQTTPAFANTMQTIGANVTPSGLSQIPIGSGFDLGVIGDIIMHKGRSFLTLGSLVSAIQMDGDSTIVLNQKIITQDNKNSTIFVGDNIPFTGSVVQTVGQSQQTTANIEYRDIGVSLSITPMLGEGDIITLDIDEQITESLGDAQTSTTNVGGIRTTKTNMATHVHVPDKHFLVLSGGVRNARSHQRTGIPCLGGLPWVGHVFSKKRQHNEKRNILIFVRPHIIHSFDEYKDITQSQPLPEGVTEETIDK